jgi:hypothetical protein
MAHLHRWALAFLGSGLGSLRDSATSVWPSVTIPHRADSRQADILGAGADGRRDHLRATLAAPDPRRDRRGMFSISDADVAAIVDASERGGGLSAKIEVRRLFPGIPENAEALWAAMNIAGWEALLVSPPEP